MTAWPVMFAGVELRAVARVSIILIPAIIFFRLGSKQKSILDFFQLRENWIRGVIVGSGVALLYFSLDWAMNFSSRLNSLHLPVGFSIWFNFILGSPLAEEAFFRGVLLQELKGSMGTIGATLISAFAFTLLHVPQWTLLDQQSGTALLSLSVSIFTYGIIFALLLNFTRSLWAPLSAHWLNNFILLATE